MFPFVAWRLEAAEPLPGDNNDLITDKWLMSSDGNNLIDYSADVVHAHWSEIRLRGDDVNEWKMPIGGIRGCRKSAELNVSRRL